MYKLSLMLLDICEIRFNQALELIPLPRKPINPPRNPKVNFFNSTLFLGFLQLHCLVEDDKYNILVQCHNCKYAGIPITL
jgi:hypothetical protein